MIYTLGVWKDSKPIITFKHPENGFIDSFFEWLCKEIENKSNIPMAWDKQ